MSKKDLSNKCESEDVEEIRKEYIAKLEDSLDDLDFNSAAKYLKGVFWGLEKDEKEELLQKICNKYVKIKNYILRKKY